MTTIQQENDVFTLINVFTVKPENQQKLIDLLVDVSEQTMTQIPGFISANLHKSYDGRQVVNYAQWRSREDFDAMMHNSQALLHMKTAADLAEEYNPILCEVRESVSVYAPNLFNVPYATGFLDTVGQLHTVRWI